MWANVTAAQGSVVDELRPFGLGNRNALRVGRAWDPHGTWNGRRRFVGSWSRGCGLTPCASAAGTARALNLTDGRRPRASAGRHRQQQARVRRQRSLGIASDAASVDPYDLAIVNPLDV